ncbi:hypothetical protein AAFF_G00304340 [Aldrovandia affinis]|uniref:Uncharacterized protein n=1 Tax=Aldrovandia affinis TaxID=143900 RepID=A0AAD7SQ20_9TELE|nr:hypothetical protein AAFF_G00304340 [Aldrovandia affinis]
MGGDGRARSNTIAVVTVMATVTHSDQNNKTTRVTRPSGTARRPFLAVCGDVFPPRGGWAGVRVLPHYSCSEGRFITQAAGHVPRPCGSEQPGRSARVPRAVRLTARLKPHAAIWPPLHPRLPRSRDHTLHRYSDRYVRMSP